VFCTVAAAMLIGESISHSAPREGKPNVLFILADDLGWGDLSCYGHDRLRTPALDRLAQQGTLFTQFYVNGSVCSPSRCAFMTGQYPARHRIHGHYADHALNASRGMSDWLDPKVPNLAALLKSAGYATAHVGKWHLGNGPGALDPSEYGFDVAKTLVSNQRTWTEPADTFWPKSTALFVDEAIRFILLPSTPRSWNGWPTGLLHGKRRCLRARSNPRRERPTTSGPGKRRRRNEGRRRPRNRSPRPARPARIEDAGLCFRTV
jgi:hypothetical protein